jgi:nitric oxide reductase subunit C
MSGMSDMNGTADTSDVVNTHPGDAATGKVLFEKGTGDTAVPVCSTCHIVDTDEIRVGPSLKGIVVHAKMHAEERKQDVWTFLHNSIVKPNEDLMEDQPPHIYSANGVSLMFQYYGDMLTETQINDLVAYLMTLK